MDDVALGGIRYTRYGHGGAEGSGREEAECVGLN